jgi:putative addiction module component (TIGR02574 family)
MTIIVNPHTEQEEKVLLAFLESLQYDYHADDAIVLTEAQKKEILRRDKDFAEGKTTARPWDDVIKDLERVYR